MRPLELINKMGDALTLLDDLSDVKWLIIRRFPISQGIVRLLDTEAAWPSKASPPL